VLNGLDNLAEFSAIMLFCVAHYTGDHQECGLTRTDFGACVESVNIAQSNVVVTAAMDAITKVVTFVASHRVTDVGIIYPNQHVLMNFFGQLYVHVYQYFFAVSIRGSTARITICGHSATLFQCRAW